MFTGLVLVGFLFQVFPLASASFSQAPTGPGPYVSPEDIAAAALAFGSEEFVQQVTSFMDHPRETPARFANGVRPGEYLLSRPRPRRESRPRHSRSPTLQRRAVPYIEPVEQPLTEGNVNSVSPIADDINPRVVSNWNRETYVAMDRRRLPRQPRRENGYPCPHCDRTFDRQRDLNRHTRYHDPPQHCSYPDCDFRYNFPRELNRHIAERHDFSRRVPCREPGCTYSNARVERVRTHESRGVHRYEESDGSIDSETGRLIIHEESFDDTPFQPSL